ncbi:MAG: serpin family protein [Bacteroidales bacterium]|jgi:serpin B|nr:serpin family protein [Bacteroidales bacterium]
MKYSALMFLSLTAITGFISCSKENNGQQPDLTPKTLELTAKGAEVIEYGNEFGVELFTKVAIDENKNLMLSPLSASTALTMLLNGCKEDTYNQIKEMLKYPEGMTMSEINEVYRSLVAQLLAVDPKVKLALANAIFYRQGFSVKNPFLNTMNTDFDAEIAGLDFSLPSALTTINKWASDNTNGKIPKVLDEISDDAVMFIMNALYFKGDWSYEFDKALTSDRPFYTSPSVSVNASTMKGEVGSKVTFGSGYRAIELPYGRTNFTMVVIVPEGTLPEFNTSFDTEKWNTITSAFDDQEKFGELTVYMPKFKFSYEKFLNDQLKSLGMVDAFIPDLANLSGISDASIYVDFVKQNTFVEVDEKGTEAAAVTTIGIETTSFPPKPQEFVIDKPFVFAIRERTTNALLFIGQVVNPLNQ